ncbi:MAG: hypothetical protein GY915_02680 [bacterium]|nr:hypothetical protein [bacterium]
MNESGAKECITWCTGTPFGAAVTACQARLDSFGADPAELARIKREIDAKSGELKIIQNDLAKAISGLKGLDPSLKGEDVLNPLALETDLSQINNQIKGIQALLAASDTVGAQRQIDAINERLKTVRERVSTGNKKLLQLAAQATERTGQLGEVSGLQKQLEGAKTGSGPALGAGFSDLQKRLADLNKKLESGDIKSQEATPLIDGLEKDIKSFLDEAERKKLAPPPPKLNIPPPPSGKDGPPLPPGEGLLFLRATGLHWMVRPLQSGFRLLFRHKSLTVQQKKCGPGPKNSLRAREKRNSLAMSLFINGIKSLEMGTSLLDFGIAQKLLKVQRKLKQPF